MDSVQAPRRLEGQVFTWDFGGSQRGVLPSLVGRLSDLRHSGVSLLWWNCPLGSQLGALPPVGRFHPISAKFCLLPRTYAPDSVCARLSRTRIVIHT